MNQGRLAFILLLIVVLPTHQVVAPQRDINAEESVAVNVMRLRKHANLDAVKRLEGSAFAAAACESARHGRSDKISVDGANYSAVIYSTAYPEDAEPITALATRALKADDRMITGACYANTPAFPSGRYWVAIGVVNGANERAVAQLLGAHPGHHGE
jgi:hypothetical protein